MATFLMGFGFLLCTYLCTLQIIKTGEILLYLNEVKCPSTLLDTFFEFFFNVQSSKGPWTSFLLHLIDAIYYWILNLGTVNFSAV